MPTNEIHTSPAPFVGPCSAGAIDPDGFTIYCGCDDCGAMYAAESEAECYAEGAWLRAAEQGYPGYADDPRELALEAMDPQVNGEWLGA